MNSQVSYKNDMLTVCSACMLTSERPLEVVIMLTFHDDSAHRNVALFSLIPMSLNTSLFHIVTALTHYSAQGMCSLEL